MLRHRVQGNAVDRRGYIEVRRVLNGTNGGCFEALKLEEESVLYGIHKGQREVQPANVRRTEVSSKADEE